MDGSPPGILWLTLAANEEKSHHLGHVGWLPHEDLINIDKPTIDTIVILIIDL